jgi:L-cysteine:1D-myo-inositol 2-amino-2-deoxy-alpha-D-glucopyranoside ligase
VRLFDTSSKSVVITKPEAAARMYVCGITPYDATHIGHAATYIAFDLLNRAWRDAGHAVHYTQNVTDIDDPLLERATATGQDWRDVALRETELFRNDMAALSVIPPTDYIGAVEAIPEVVRRIEQLQALGLVYRVEDDFYLDISADARFGSVANLPREEMIAIFAERGGDPDRPGKRDALDPLLWMAGRPGEPHWPTTLGSGRPGWHIECVAIGLQHLGFSFDVQGGGSDLAFPHHEMGASQGQLLCQDWPFAKAYVHAGMVHLDGHKMSKSRGNLVFVSKLRESGEDPAAIRLAILAHHYRSDWEWTEECLVAARHRLDSWRRACDAQLGASGQDLLAQIRTHLSNDLDAPAALAAVDAWVAKSATDKSDESAGSLTRDAVMALLGVRA